MSEEIPHVRRRPEQARSRASLQTILTATADLIGQHGVDGISMTDIASEAGLSKAALYRYFPNRRSLIRELAVMEFERQRDAIVTSAERLSNGDPRQMLTDGLREYFEAHLAEPWRVPLRIAIHSDAELSALDLADSRRNARLIAELINDRLGGFDVDQLTQRTLLVLELLDGMIRLTTRIDTDEAEQMISQFCQMAAAQIFGAAETA